MAFVPPNVTQAVGLLVEFTESVAATLDAAGLTPQQSDAAPSSTEPQGS